MKFTCFKQRALQPMLYMYEDIPYMLRNMNDITLNKKMLSKV